jgi:hypothetical protein
MPGIIPVMIEGGKLAETRRFDIFQDPGPIFDFVSVGILKIIDVTSKLSRDFRSVAFPFALDRFARPGL